MPTSFNSGVADLPQVFGDQLVVSESERVARLPGRVGRGRLRSRRQRGQGVHRRHRPQVAQHYRLCGFDPEACTSKAIRRPFSITDNRNGTITVSYAGFATYTVPGSFPAGGFNVVFKDHNYTPDKDGAPVGYTWHWDNIIVK